MSKRFPWVLGAFLVVCGLTGGQAFAQAARIKIEFGFMLAGKEMPAGTYEIRTEGQAMSRLTIRNVDTGDQAMPPVLTRLADTGGTVASLAFDIADGKHYLSEVRLPREDGFLLAGAPGEHKHEKVQAKE